MQVRPITPEALAEELAERLISSVLDHPVRVAVDGAPASRPEVLADALVDPLRLRGRPVQRISGRDFLRPASLRLEHGREDADGLYTDWLDVAALRREVLDPLGPAGSRRVLPALWDADRDRSSRADYVLLAQNGILLFDGMLLLGHGLPLDFVVHLSLSPAALARRTDEAEHWTLPAFRRYTEEVQPECVADAIVRADDPRRPAFLLRQA